jgi:hypothetical protein
MKTSGSIDGYNDSTDEYQFILKPLNGEREITIYAYMVKI